MIRDGTILQRVQHRFVVIPPPHFFSFKLFHFLFFAHLFPILFLFALLLLVHDASETLLFEPRSEKTGLRGFRPGPTQTRSYNHRRWLEA